MIPFKGFPKIPRLSREIIITEKIDGTNGCIYIEDDIFLVGSRTRWITVENDNHGFAKWAVDHKEELSIYLGYGLHYGEWWGSGIQRGYDLPKGEKRFSLFNTHKWSDDNIRPACCHVVPVITTGPFETYTINEALKKLRETGSIASPGFDRPEGIIIYHVAGNLLFKKTLEKDDQPKFLGQG
jgi:hypothetical protein